MNSTDDHPILLSLLAPETRRNDCALAELREALLARGVNSRCWRMFLEYGDALLQPLGVLIKSRSAERNLRNAIYFLRLVQAGEMDVAPPRELVAALSRVRLPLEGLEALPNHLFRAAWKECARRIYLGADVTGWLDQEVVPVFDWYLAVSETVDGEVRGRHCGNWTTHQRRWKLWQEAPANPRGTRRWAVLVPILRHGAFVVRELSDEASLYREAEAMSHCVGSYVGECLRREAHIFSITDRRSGARVATLSLERQADGEWEAGELKAAHNASVIGLRGIDEVVMALLRCVQDQRC